MKFCLYISIICVLLFSANWVYSLSYSESLPARENYEKVSQQDISRARLLESYLKRYKIQINDLYLSYDIQNSAILKETNAKIDDMTQALRRIQKRPVDPDAVGEVISKIISEITVIDNKMEERLQKQKNIFDEQLIQKKKQYIAVWKKLRSALDTISARLTSVLSQKETLSQKEKAIVRSLKRIRDESEKIKRFQDIPFSTEAQMKNYFQTSIINIKREIGIIRTITR